MEAGEKNSLAQENRALLSLCLSLESAATEFTLSAVTREPELVDTLAYRSLIETLQQARTVFRIVFEQPGG